MQTKKFIYIAVGFFVLIMIVVIAVLVSSSGKKKTTNTTTLTIWNFDEDKTNYDQPISSFESSKKIKINYVKKDLSTYYTEAVNAIAAGKGPDIWVLPGNTLVQYQDLLTPMPDKKMATGKKSDIEVYKETYPGSVSQDNILGNKVYGRPLTLQSLQLFFNRAVFSKVLYQYRQSNQGYDRATDDLLSKGPTNWDDFVKVVKLLTQKNGANITQSAVAMGTANVSNANDILTLIMLQNGTKMVADDQLSALFQTDQKNFETSINFPGTKALDFFASFANSSNDNYTWNDSLGDTLHAFAAGKTGMMFGYSTQVQDLKRIDPNLDYQIIPVPQIKETKNPVNVADYKTFTVTKNAQDPTLAWDFILNLTNQTNTGSYCTRTKQDSARLDSLSGSDQNIKILASWYNPNPTETENSFQGMIKQVNEGKNSQTAIENAAGQVTTLLSKLKQ
jgi:ABC-type glycerol-3-phosphate transport system substrate-binding protein